MTIASRYRIVDAIFVGRLGSEALDAMSVIFPITLSFVVIASGTGVGGTSLISRMVPGFFFQGISKGFSTTGRTVAQHFVFFSSFIFILPNSFGIKRMRIVSPLADILSLLLGLLWMTIHFRKQKILLFGWKAK